MFLSLILINRV